MLRTLLALTVVAAAALQVQVRADDSPSSPHSIDKRYVAALARNGDLPLFFRKEWNKKLHPVMSGNRNSLLASPDKRYVGALARNGELPLGKRSDDSEEVDNLLHDLQLMDDEKRSMASLARSGNMPVMYEDDKRSIASLARSGNLPFGEEGKRSIASLARTGNLPSLYEDDKRSIASLARSGNLPFSEGKRSVEALARAGYLPFPRPNTESNSVDDEDDGMGKRGISVLAKNGQLQLLGSQGLFSDDNSSEFKRGGIGSLARNGYLNQKRSFGNSEDMEDLIQELYQEEQEVGKRNIGSLARSFNLPQGGKRNIGALARGGGLSGVRYVGSKKNDYDVDDLFQDEEKRNLASVARNRFATLREGKRYLGALARTHGLPYNSAMTKKDDMGVEDEVKRNIGAMARNWNFPDHLRLGKRPLYADDVESDMEDIAKRYVAALLRHGRLPVGVDRNEQDSSKDEGKRHVGSLAAQSSPFRPKKSEGEDNHETKRSAPAGRRKRQAYLAPASSSDEYPMPVLQNSDLFDYEDMMEIMSGGAAPEKRFLGWPDAEVRPQPSKRHIGALARLGWLPSFRGPRYSRSGRTGKRSVFREDPSDGPQSPEDDVAFWPETATLKEHLNREMLETGVDPVKRFLLLPAIDNILLRRLYPHRVNPL